jgi:hypothetical protein
MNAASGKGVSMTTTNVLNEQVRRYPDETFEHWSLERDETDDLEEFRVLLQSCDVRDLIEAARMRGLSATGLARRLVRDFCDERGAPYPLQASRFSRWRIDDPECKRRPAIGRV